MALLFVLAPLGSGWAAAAVYLAAAVLLAAAAVFDARWMELPDTFSWMLAGLALLRLAALGWGTDDWGALVVNSLVGLAVGAGFFGLQYLASRGKWIGSGDILLGASLGLLLGWPATSLALVLAYVAGALAAVPLLAGRSRGWSSAVAFGPFLAFGGLAALRFGSGLMQWLGWV
jgi:leader peptidase (prepilin peptidase)/N-methyltransferase